MDFDIPGDPLDRVHRGRIGMELPALQQHFPEVSPGNFGGHTVYSKRNLDGSYSLLDSSSLREDGHVLYDLSTERIQERNYLLGLRLRKLKE